MVTGGAGHHPELLTCTIEVTIMWLLQTVVADPDLQQEVGAKFL